MSRPWLKRCAIGAMTVVMTVSSLPMAAFADPNGYNGGNAFANVNGEQVTIGNDAITRTFSIAGEKLTTLEIDNKRANTKLTPGVDSEEFIIKRTKKDAVGQQPIDQTGWTATADSEENIGEGAPHHGHASNIIDNDQSTFWHTAYENGGANKPGNREMPHEVVIDLNGATTFESFSYDPRYTDGNGTDINGNIGEYTLWVSAAEDAPSIDGDHAAAGWTKVMDGSFNYEGNKGEAIHVNIPDDKIDACKGVQCVMLEARTSKNGQKFAGGEEFDLYAEKWVEPVKSDMFLKSSELELDGDPVVSDTSATINKQQKAGKKLSFKFKPVEFNGATYTVTENIVAYNGDHYMRKYLEISVPEEDKLDAEIDYIDLESLNVTNSKGQWTIPTDQGSIVGTPMERAIIGQPFYADGMFFGCEFPAADTQIVTENGDQKIGRPRYYTGKTMDRLATDKQASRAEDGSIHYATWPTVVGSATAEDYRVVQADFFDYINDIAAPSEFRIQYNSWYDDEKNISDKTILSSFAEIDREMSSTELRPLDSYVVDDGWTNYSANPGFWEFNSKFPNGFAPSSELVQNFGSNFGAWIGPRGGYGTEGPIADSLQAQNISVKAGGSIDVADRTYLERYAQRVNEFQDKYRVNYWKWDGFADQAQYNHYKRYGAGDGVPKHTSELGITKTKGHMIGGTNDMYHSSDMWEAWIDLYETVRANAEKNHIPNYWISSTTHTMPSPWLLQWVNSVWLQCQFDHARSEHGSTVHDGNLNARDAVYYSFVEKHQFQFPLNHIYNHDPVYGKSGTSMTAETATAEQFQNYLYTMAGRGTAFWELYYSDSLFDTEKYEVNAEFLNWYEENFHLLRNARMFGGWPIDGVTLDTGVKVLDKHLVQLANDGNRIYNTYGYAGFEGDKGILTIRNANAEKAQNLDFTFDDATLGVKGAKGEKFDYVVERRHTQEGATSKVADKGTFTIGEKVSLELQPEESLTIRVTKQDEGDKRGPSIETVRHNGGAELIVRMDEKVKGDAALTVNGDKIAADKVKRSADGVTFRIELDKAPEQGAKLEVKVSGITDMAGNALSGNAAAIDFHKGGVVVSRCSSRLTNYAKKLASSGESLVSKTGFSVSSQVIGTGHGPLVRQEGAYELGIDENGMPYLDVNGVRAVGKVEVNDGAKHTVVGVRENNGILKVYVDGAISGSKYDAKNFHHELPAGDILFAGGAFDKTTDQASAKVFDCALGYDEVAKMHEKLNPNTETHNLAAGRSVIAKWTETGDDAVKANEGAMSNITNGDKSSSAFGVFGADGKTDSSYMELDLGDVREIDSVGLWRYFQDGRTYRDTVIALSEDSDFSKDVEIVYNSDKGNKHGLGAGKDKAYAETESGKSFAAPKGTKARYVRVYMRGQDDQKTTNHVVELEVIGRDLPAEQGAEIDTSALYKRIDEVRAAIESGKYTAESVQKVMDKLEAAELVADCPKDEAQVKAVLKSLEGIESLLKKALVVSFKFVDAPEGVAAPEALTVEEGAALGDKLPTPAAVEGYSFVGWFTDQACSAGHEFTGETKVSADMTIYGKWVKGEVPAPPTTDPEQKPEQKPTTKPEQKPGSGAELPKTGDDSMLPIAAAGVAGAALVGAAVVLNKRRRAE